MKLIVAVIFSTMALAVSKCSQLLSHSATDINIDTLVYLIYHNRYITIPLIKYSIELIE